MTDKEIKRHYIEGYSRDIEDVARIRHEVERRLLDDMRQKGYAPLLELPPHLGTHWNEEKGVMEWRITIQSIYVGDQAQQIEGILDNKPIGTLRNKPSESCKN